MGAVFGRLYTLSLNRFDLTIAVTPTEETSQGWDVRVGVIDWSQHIWFSTLLWSYFSECRFFWAKCRILASISLCGCIMKHSLQQDHWNADCTLGKSELPLSVWVCEVKGLSTSVWVCYCKSGLCFNTLTQHMDAVFPWRWPCSLLLGQTIVFWFTA